MRQSLSTNVFLHRFYKMTSAVVHANDPRFCKKQPFIVLALVPNYKVERIFMERILSMKRFLKSGL